ncbi:HEAT repeat domain-containing protein [Kitasatospora sp. NPDC088346]|uniref:HEAT repeat domain-containing protein n=1 Tax=Kitasatospora sp. NPDC088346 TaxID=3364073 RepID=UPI00382CAA56
MTFDPDARTTDDLFAGALAEQEDEADLPVPCLVALHGRPTRDVFDRAVGLLSAAEPVRRLLGVLVLRELGPLDGDRRRPFTAETVRLLRRAMPHEPDPRVLGGMISALGFLGATEALDTVLGYARHQAWQVRFGVAAALPCVADPDRTEERVVDVLLRLGADEDEDVRWYALYARFNETSGVPAERRRAWASALVDAAGAGADPEAGAERCAELRHIGTTLEEDADEVLRGLLLSAGGPAVTT